MVLKNTTSSKLISALSCIFTWSIYIKGLAAHLNIMYKYVLLCVNGKNGITNLQRQIAFKTVIYV